MPDPTFLGLVRFGGGPGCPCGGPIQGWRKVRAYKARHGWPLFDSETFEAYLTQEVSGEGIGSYGATRTINPLTGLSDGAPWVYVPGQGDWFPDVGYFLMEPSPAVLPIGKHQNSEFDQVQVGQVTLSNPYTFGRLQSDLSEILFSEPANPMGRPSGSVTLAARAEVSLPIDVARQEPGSTSAVAYAPRGRFDSQGDAAIVRWEPAPANQSRAINGGIYVHPTGSQWDLESQDTVRRIYRLRTQYLRGGVGRRGFYSRERGLLSFSGFYSIQDVLSVQNIGEEVLDDSGRVYYRHTGPYLDITSPDIPEHQHWETLMTLVRTIRLGDVPPGGTPYQESSWAGGPGSLAC